MNFRDIVWTYTLSNNMPVSLLFAGYFFLVITLYVMIILKCAFVCLAANAVFLFRSQSALVTNTTLGQKCTTRWAWPTLQSPYTWPTLLLTMIPGVPRANSPTPRPVFHGTMAMAIWPMVDTMMADLFPIKSLVPGRSGCHFRIFSLVLSIDFSRSSNEYTLRWIPRDLTDDKSTLVRVMAWCRQSKRYYLSQCRPRSMLPYGVTRPQWLYNERIVMMSYYLYSTGFNANDRSSHRICGGRLQFSVWYYSDIMQAWAPWRFKLPKIWLFVQQFGQADIKQKHRSSTLLVLVSESIGRMWISLTEEMYKAFLCHDTMLTLH